MQVTVMQNYSAPMNKLNCSGVINGRERSMRETDALTVVVPLQLCIKRELQVLQLSGQLLCAVFATTSRTASWSTVKMFN
jgi:hypothetical protein